MKKILSLLVILILVHPIFASDVVMENSSSAQDNQFTMDDEAIALQEDANTGQSEALVDRVTLDQDEAMSEGDVVKLESKQSDVSSFLRNIKDLELFNTISELQKHEARLYELIRIFRPGNLTTACRFASDGQKLLKILTQMAQDNYTDKEINKTALDLARFIATKKNTRWFNHFYDTLQRVKGVATDLFVTLEKLNTLL